MKDSPLKGADMEGVVFSGGNIMVKDNPAAVVSFRSIIAANKGRVIKTTNSSIPNALRLKKYTRAVHSVAFVEVEVDEQLGIINVIRALTTVCCKQS